LPGGAAGADALATDADVGALLQRHWQAGALVAAICAAPIALVAHGIGRGLPATSHPSVLARLAGHFEVREARVVESGRLVTSRGPGTAFDFALHLVARLCDQATRDRVAGPMML
jgi:putative intracellular protease/amidase